MAGLNWAAWRHVILADPLQFGAGLSMNVVSTQRPELTVRDLQAFIALEQRARTAESIAELAFILANETISLVQYSQAAIVETNGKVVCLSGVSLPDTRSPFIGFLAQLVRSLPHDRTSPLVIEKIHLPQGLADTWDNWLAPSALWISSEANGWGLLVVREEPFTESEMSWLARLTTVFQHARSALNTPRSLRGWRWPSATFKFVILVMILLSSAAPVRLTVLAPAEIVPINPTIIKSPIDGVIDKIFVQPNEAVQAGRRLIDLDTTALSGKLDVAVKDLAAAQAEYRQTMQQALSDAKVRTQLPAINGRIDMRSSEVAYLRRMLEKTRLTAPTAGIAIFGDPTELLGRPVSVGEKIMSLAQEKEVEIEAWVGLGDAIELTPGANVMLILNAAPLSPVYGHVRYMAYEAQARPDGTTGYRLRAALADGAQRPRLGMRGTLRLEGDRVPVAYWLLRRPLAAVRQFLGV